LPGDGAGEAQGRWRVAKRILTQFLEAKRWQKLNEDTRPYVLAGGELLVRTGPPALVPVPLEIDDVVSGSRSGNRDCGFRR
jgi:hypothetical protein